MTFVLRMAVREMRASWRRLLFFFVCVAVGVGAIVAIRSVVQSVREGLQREVRTLMAADAIVQTNRPWDPGVRSAIEARLARAAVLARAEVIETSTMARPADPGNTRVRMVELLGVDEAFPLHGRVTLADGRAYAHALLRGQGALVRPELLTQLDLRVGDQLRLGELAFTIRGVVDNEPGRRVGAFSFGSRVLVDRADLLRAGLLVFGSRARYAVMLRVAEADLEPLVRDLRQSFRQRFVSVRWYRGAEDEIGEDLQRAEDYLSLVGFVMLVLGGVGVWSVTRVFVRQKLRHVAVLKCLGASWPRVFGVYVIQVLVLGLAGSLLGVALAWVGVWAIPARLLAGLPGVALALTPSAVAQGLGVGLLVSFLFSAVPLLDVRSVKPLLLLRDSAGIERPGAAGPATGTWRWAALRARGARVDWTRAAVTMAVGLGLVGLASWQASSLRVGAIVSGGFVTLAVVLHLAGLALVKAVQPLRSVRWFPLRHAVLSLGRPGNQTRVILLAVGLGAFFIIGVQALQQNLVRELSLNLASDGPDMFLIDIQPDQAAGVRRLVTDAGLGAGLRLLPVLRARVTGVRGQRVSLEGVEDVRRQGSLAREYVVTYRDGLEANEQLLEGEFWPAARSPGAEVSIEEGIRDRFGIRVGDRVRFDILGRVLEARVGSVRRVEWRDTRAGGFMFVFRPGSLERAPSTAIALFRGPADAMARARLQRDVVDAFPNVSAIDVRDVARTVESVLGNLTLAISVVGAVAVLSGLLILVGAVAMTKFQRLHEAAVLKTLGASSRTVAATLAVEYGALGTLAGVVAALGATALTWVVSRQVLDIRWSPPVGIGIIGLVVTGVVACVVGVAASLDVLRRKPLATLRAE